MVAEVVSLPQGVEVLFALMQDVGVKVAVERIVPRSWRYDVDGDLAVERSEPSSWWW